jgi:hypothetical protein
MALADSCYYRSHPHLNIIKSAMSTADLPQAIEFIRQDLSVPDESIQLALKQSQSDYGSLPMVLWQYGLVSLQQLDRLYDWFEVYIY